MTACTFILGPSVDGTRAGRRCSDEAVDGNRCARHSTSVVSRVAPGVCPGGEYVPCHNRPGLDGGLCDTCVAEQERASTRTVSRR